MYSHCTTGGWLPGNQIDGTKAEFVRIPHADVSLHRIGNGDGDESLVLLSDVLPTGFECGAVNGKVEPGVQRLITHRFELENIVDAYETVAHAAATGRAEGKHRGVI